MEREIAASYEPKMNSEVRIFESSDDMATDLAEYISQVSEISVKERGYFAIALSGGPLVSFMWKLCEAPYNKTLDWSKWYIFWADERAVAKNHVESNYKLTKEGFLSKVPILNGHVYSINDNVTVEDAATDYEFVIRQLVKIRTVGVSESNDCPKFDLILLGIGSDGHVASLFPNHPALELKDDWVTYITDSPEPPPERITFTLPVINSASNIAIVAIGEDKAKVVPFAISDSCEGQDAHRYPLEWFSQRTGSWCGFWTRRLPHLSRLRTMLSSIKSFDTIVGTLLQRVKVMCFDGRSSSSLIYVAWALVLWKAI